MKKRIFKKKAVYYLAVITSFALLLFSFVAVISLFNNFSILKLLVLSLSMILNLSTFINLIERYSKAFLLLNISICYFIFLCGGVALAESLANGFSLRNNPYKFLLLFTLILIIINKFKAKEDKSEGEIESIGTHND
jgi:hypothetical protein